MNAPYRFLRYPCLVLLVATAAGCAGTPTSPRPSAGEDGTARLNAAGPLPTTHPLKTPERPARDFDYAL